MSVIAQGCSSKLVNILAKLKLLTGIECKTNLDPSVVTPRNVMKACIQQWCTAAEVKAKALHARTSTYSVNDSPNEGHLSYKGHFVLSYILSPPTAVVYYNIYYQTTLISSMGGKS